MMKLNVGPLFSLTSKTNNCWHLILLVAMRFDLDCGGNGDGDDGGDDMIG